MVSSQSLELYIQGRFQWGGGGRAPGARPPKIGEDMIFWRKIVNFHTKYPKYYRASLRSAQFFLSAPPNLKSWIRPCIYTIFFYSFFLFKSLKFKRLWCLLGSPSWYYYRLLPLLITDRVPEKLFLSQWPYITKFYPVNTIWLLK